MNILYITSLFVKKSSSASIRNISLVNGLTRLGHNIQILTIKYPDVVIDPFLVNSVDNPIKIIEVDSGLISRYIPADLKNDNRKTESRIFSFLRKIIKEIYYFPDVDRKWISSCRNLKFDHIDLIVSSSDTKTSHFTALRIKSFFPNIPWFQIWGDPWYFDIGNNSFIRKLRSFYAERKLLLTADKVFYISLPTFEQMISVFPFLSGKCNYLPRGYLKECISFRNNKKDIHIVYTGLLIGRNIEPLISAVQSYNKKSGEKNIVIDIYGRLNVSEQDKINKYDFINYYGFVNADQIYEIYTTADILLFISNAAETTQIPGKLYDYFGTQCTILALVEDIDNSVSSFIKNTKRCVVFQNKIDKIDLSIVINDIGSRDIVREYSPETIASKLISEYNGASNDPNH